MGNPGEGEEAGHLHGMQGMITDAGVPSEEVYNAELHRLEHQYEDRLHGMSDANQRSENRNKNINMGHAERNYLRNQHQAQYHNALKPVAQLQNNVRVNNEHHHHYPREIAQGEEFEKEICPCSKILYFQVSDETMTERLLQRGKSSGRVDDNVETIKKRLDTFHQHSEPVMAHFASKCAAIPAERSVDDIFADVQKALG